MKVLLDTDIISEVYRGKDAVVWARADNHKRGHGVLHISTITEVEVARGWHQAGRPKSAEEFRLWVAAECEALPLDSHVSWLAGEIAGALNRTGQGIGLADVCIAATAIRHGLVLVTGNIEHHDRVRAAGFELELDNWRQPAPAPIG
jgi:tRNA(fMet)-specific endonuclease VapC